MCQQHAICRNSFYTPSKNCYSKKFIVRKPVCVYASCSIKYIQIITDVISSWVIIGIQVKNALDMLYKALIFIVGIQSVYLCKPAIHISTGSIFFDYILLDCKAYQIAFWIHQHSPVFIHRT